MKLLVYQAIFLAFLPFLSIAEETFAQERILRKLIDLYDAKIKPVNSYLNFLSNLKVDILSSLTKPHEWQANETPGRKYDFIIVGSGSAGAVIANRLSEVGAWNILLLEAGKGENFVSSIPVVAAALQNTHYDWQYLMEFDPGFARGMVNNLLAYPRGRALGGTSVINYMIYTRGNPVDYNRWAALGNPGWSYQDILPYFLKSENSSLKYENPYFHNHDGYLSVEDTYQSVLVDAFVKGGSQMGYSRVDYSSPDQIGFGTVQSNLKRGRRHSVASAFLYPFKCRKNLHVLTSAFVTKILIDPNSRNAYGVRYERNGREYTAIASKEVIISAGTFSSAQLLMLSGVGPREHLQELGIHTLVNLPVGSFMQDHITFVGLVFTINQDVSLSLRNGLTIDAIRRWLVNGTGPLSSLGAVEGVGYIKTPISDDPEPNFPDMELLFVGSSLNGDLGLVNRRVMRIRDDIYDRIWKPLDNVPAWTVFPMLVHPKSVGFMRLRSDSPHSSPLFYGNYLSDSEGKDIDTFVAVIKFIIQLSKTPAFQQYGSRLHNVPIPGCEFFEFGSDPYWKCAVRTLSSTLHHQVGTNRMGSRGDPMAVVNNELRVHGIGRLRVADCSVIPFAITAHTNAPAIMIGEKASDMIKQAWGTYR